MGTPSSAPPTLPSLAGGPTSFSVVIPCYNASRYISDTLDSVLRQTYTHFEVLVVDDASSDNSRQIVEGYTHQDPRVQLIALDRRSGGPASPRNAGIAAARGDYIAFLDSDDLWAQNKLLHDAEFLRCHDVDLLFSGAFYFRDRPENVVYIMKARPLNGTFLFRNRVPLLSLCAKRSSFTQDKLLFDPDPCLVAIEDYHFLLRAYLEGKRIVCRDGIDTYYRQDSGTSIYGRHAFSRVLLRHVYNLSKIALQFSFGVPRFYGLLVVLTAFLCLKRLRGSL